MVTGTGLRKTRRILLPAVGIPNDNAAQKKSAEVRYVVLIGSVIVCF